jgi:tetratricopeptide (TPR) repeat protein
MKKQIWWLIGSLVLLAGCNFPGLTPVTPATSIPADSEPQVAVPTPLPATTATLPAAPGPTITTSDPVCVPPGELRALEAVGFGEYPQAILAYLNRGATPEALDKALADAGVGNVPLAVVAADLTGDGVRDIVVSIFNPRSEAIVPPGKAMIYVCTSGQFTLAYNEDSGRGFGVPHIWYVQDLDADGAAEVVLSQATCGAHTCFDDLEVLGWDGGTFTNRLEGETLDLPYPDVRVEDPDGDGIYELAVVAGGFGSVGAGPQREITRRWSLDQANGRWIAQADTQGASNFRIHILHDAEAAARAGAYEQALALYQRVVTDPTLDEWADPETERANLAAYARFKQVVVYTILGQADFAGIALDELQAAYPEDSRQDAYVLLAEAFYTGWESGSVEAGCAAAAAYAGEHTEAVLAPLGPGAFGYGNPELIPADMCPPL